MGKFDLPGEGDLTMPLGPLEGVAIALALLTTGLYGYVGWLMLHRIGTGAARWAMIAFATWWLALGLLTGMRAVVITAIAIGGDDALIGGTYALASSLLISVGLFGLLYYLVFLYTGKTKYAIPLAIFHAGLYLFLTYIVLFLEPVGVAPGIDGDAIYARELTAGLARATTLLVIGPVAVASILYGSLLFRLKDRLHRYRVALVSSSFFIWFGLFPGLGLLTGLSAAGWWPLASRLMGVLVPLFIVGAYRPPRSLDRWLRTEKPESPNASTTTGEGSY